MRNASLNYRQTSCRLVLVMDPSYVPVRISGPIALLDAETALDVIAAGEYRRVSRAIAALESTGAV